MSSVAPNINKLTTPRVPSLSLDLNEFHCLGPSVSRLEIWVSERFRSTNKRVSHTNPFNKILFLLVYSSPT